MDQIKKMLAYIKKNNFWFLTGLIAVTFTVGYVVARTSLASRIKTRSDALDGQFKAVKSVQSESSTHPNAFSHTQMDRLIAGISDDVKKAWALQYDRQSKIFEWPEEALQPDKKAVTLAKLKALMPIETTLPFPLDEKKEPLTLQERNTYRDYIKERFSQLAKIIGAEWHAKMRVGSRAAGSTMMAGGMGGMGMEGGMAGMPGGMPGMSGMPGMDSGAMAGMGTDMPGGMPGSEGGMMGYGMPMRKPGEKPPLVNWALNSQQELMDNICYWYSPNKPPTTLQICYSQEDLWILEGILRIIAATNEGARANFQAAVKEIEFIRFGSSAMYPSGVVIMQQDMVAGGGMGMDGMMGMGGSEGGAMMGMGMGMGGSEGGAMMGMDGGMGMGEGGMGQMMEIDPANNRYVDSGVAQAEGDVDASATATSDPSMSADMGMATVGGSANTTFKPLPAEQLRTAMQSNQPADAPYVVAKRIPVRMRFSKMDARKLSSLIAECGNPGTPNDPRLVLEVKQVRINGVAQAPGMGGMGGMGMGMPGMDAGMGAGMPGGMGMPGMDSPMAGGMDTGMPGGMGSEGGMMPGGMDGGMSGMPGMGGMSGMMPRNPSDVPVEIYGIIYLYNPVDMQKLGLENVKPEGAADDSSAATQVPSSTPVPSPQDSPAVADPNTSISSPINDGSTPVVPTPPASNPVAPPSVPVSPAVPSSVSPAPNSGGVGNPAPDGSAAGASP